MTRLTVSCLLIVALLGAIVFSPQGQGNFLWLHTLHNFAHGPVFGCIAVLLLYGLRGSERFASQSLVRQYGAVFALAVALAFATELAQVQTKRDASLDDVVTDLLGTTGFLLVCRAFDLAARGSNIANRTAFALAGAVAFAVLAWPLVSMSHAYSLRASCFPFIVDFACGAGAQFLHARHARVEIVPVPRPWASHSEEKALHIHFYGDQWPGIDIGEPMPDWRSYRQLAVEIINPLERELQITIRIDDRQHNKRFHDRYNGRFILPPLERTTLHIPLTEIEAAPHHRKFDLQNVARLLIFRRVADPGDAIYLIRVRLE
jgi:hypothetical protein